LGSPRRPARAPLDPRVSGSPRQAPAEADAGDTPAPATDLGAWALVVMALAGLGISAYLTTVHYAGGAAVCAISGVFNCGSVLTSSYSVVPGTQVPVTVPGMLWFLVSGGLAAAAIGFRASGRSSKLAS